MTARAIILRRRSERRARRTGAATIMVNCRALGKAMDEQSRRAEKARRAERRRERRRLERDARARLLRGLAAVGIRRRCSLLSPWATWLAEQRVPGLRKLIPEWLAEWTVDGAIEAMRQPYTHEVEETAT